MSIFLWCPTTICIRKWSIKRIFFVTCSYYCTLLCSSCRLQWCIATMYKSKLYFQRFNYLTKSLELMDVQSEKRKIVTMFPKLHLHQSISSNITWMHSLSCKVYQRGVLHVRNKQSHCLITSRAAGLIGTNHMMKRLLCEHSQKLKQKTCLNSWKTPLPILSDRGFRFCQESVAMLNFIVEPLWCVTCANLLSQQWIQF